MDTRGNRARQYSKPFRVIYSATATVGEVKGITYYAAYLCDSVARSRVSLYLYLQSDRFFAPNCRVIRFANSMSRDMGVCICIYTAVSV